MKPLAPTPLWTSPSFWLLAGVAVEVWLTAWDLCAAPWRTACFTNGGWGAGLAPRTLVSRDTLTTTRRVALLPRPQRATLSAIALKPELAP
jgi:hypothetical protein